MMDDLHRMTDVPNEGTEGVFTGDWVPRIKLDGTACAIIKGKLYKRYDCKLDKKGYRKTHPEGWKHCEPNPDLITGHWPGWAPVTDADKYHREAWDNCWISDSKEDGTYELIGSKIQGNPYDMKDFHALVQHNLCRMIELTMPMTYHSLKADLTKLDEEGIVFHGPDGQFFKLRRKDFGLSWPIS